MIFGEQQRTRIAAYGLILEGQSMVLCRIAAHVDDAGGWWTLPGGGLDFGEDPASAMVREVFEETGLTVEPAGIAGIDSLLLVDDGRAFHGIRIIYWAKIVDGQLTDEADGSTDHCEWIALDEAEALPLVDLAHVGIELALNGGRRL